MRQRRLPRTDEREVPQRRLRVIIEDPGLAGDPGFIDGPALPFDVSVCAGPGSSREVCPLVLQGRCPLGPCDVVVSAVDGPWSSSVRAAWREAGVPLIDARGVGPTDTRQRLDRALAAATVVVVPAGPPVGSA